MLLGALSRSSLAALLLVGCKVYDPLYCDQDKPCTDPDRPFCDLNGDYPDSEGVAHTCIPEPDIEDVDAGQDGGGADSGGGGSEADASGERRVVQLETGGSHACALLSDGALRCWGRKEALGYASEEDIGDNEHPYQGGDVPTGGRVKQVAAGSGFTCALYEPGNVRCWGANFDGQLGYGHTDALEPDVTPDELPDVQLNGAARQLAAGASHVCALLEGGDVRCWGRNSSYQLATGDQENIGDNEVPGSRSPVQIGGVVTAISAGSSHTCALLEGGFVRCWGSAGGPLGQGGIGPVGDDETPEAAGNINVGGTAIQVAPGGLHTCALLTLGRVRCWGTTLALGYQESEPIGDDETPASVGDVSVGGPVVKLSPGYGARCALLEGGNVRCWGLSSEDPLGTAMGFVAYGDGATIGDNEFPEDAGDVDVGGLVADLSRGNGGSFICALMQDGAVRCWGRNGFGNLGLGHTETIGDDETPAAADPVRVLE
jgi:alpha-tubulin suppressor-like RCC1 family protein